MLPQTEGFLPETVFHFCQVFFPVRPQGEGNLSISRGNAEIAASQIDPYDGEQGKEGGFTGFLFQLAGK